MTMMIQSMKLQTLLKTMIILIFVTNVMKKEEDSVDDSSDFVDNYKCSGPRHAGVKKSRKEDVVDSNSSPRSNHQHEITCQLLTSPERKFSSQAQHKSSEQAQWLGK